MSAVGRSSRPEIVAAIPCYNEAQFVGDVVARVRQYVDRVIVVDDGSTDRTAAVAEAAGAQLVRHSVNQGYGATIASCFEAARANHAGLLVTLDGDGQHNPDEVPDVLEPLLLGEADLVIGSRFLDKQSNVPRYRRFGIGVITLLFNAGANGKVSDAQSGFRAYRREVLDSVSLTEKGMGVSVQILVEARRHGHRIAEVPIACNYHDAGSTLNPVLHGLGVAFTVVRLRAMRGWFRRKVREQPGPRKGGT